MKTKMNPVLDALAVDFSKADDFRSYLGDREKNSTWIEGIKASDIRFEALDCDPAGIAANAAAIRVSDTAYQDTMHGAGMMCVLPGGEKFLLRDFTLAQAAFYYDIRGKALTRVSKEDLAQIMNLCAKTKPGEATVRISEEKASAILSGGKSGYSVIPMCEVFDAVDEVMLSDFPTASYLNGYYTQQFVAENWELDQNTKEIKDTMDAFGQVFKGHGQMTPILTIGTSETGDSSVTVAPKIRMAGGTTNIAMNAPMRVMHKGRNGIKDVKENLHAIYKGFEIGLEKLEHLKSTKIHYAHNCMMRMMKRVGLPRTAALDALALFDAMHGEYDCDALSIYFAICEAAFTISLEGRGGETLLKTIRAEDSCARCLGLNFKTFDYAGTVSW